MKRIYLGVITVLIIAIVPIILWHLTPSKQLNFAIIDKTVPNETYREHLGLTWALNYLKYEHQNGQYIVNQDYFGTIPDVKNKSVEEKSLPTDYSDYDVIYLADTYGVYEDDFKEESERFGARTERVFGGLEATEWNNIMKRLLSDEKSLFIAEYNSIASPTPPDVREAVLDYLEMDWNGWVGRYFDELNFEKNLEIPQWVVDEFGDEWNYEGGGFILVNDFTYEVVVLELNKHVSDEGIRLKFTDKGKEFFGLTSSPNYNYWFDIVTPYDESNVLADYDWNLTDEGEKLLDEHGIPVSFSAIISNERKNATTYYFAGDYNDVNNVPKFYRFKGMQFFYQIGQKFSSDAFYWTTYIPMLQKILEKYENREIEVEDNDKTVEYNARINGYEYEVLLDGVWQPITIKGVNLGMGKPGYFPGEAAITETEYYRWFQQIGEMNANTIRVYTLHPPGFYNALARYNAQAESPIYVLHGVWVEEEGLRDSLDAYDPETLENYRNEMKTIVDAIHGNIYLEQRAGHASGLYDTDISEYVIGWVMGIEWFPLMVQNTNELHKDIGQYEGIYFETKNAPPFEYWLAEQMDYITQYEYNQYNWIRPMSFTNWVTTDILEHPNEPDPEEDLVGVDPNVIYTKGLANEVGQFASYHVYPYYPDFLNYEEQYLNYIDHRGEKNSYAGYLSDLRSVHRMPVLIAEFGVPSSRGLTHDNPYGWTQGFLSEEQQGEILTHLFEDIISEDYLGGLVFTWQDEWFKRTWNTMDYDNPERRPYWSNAQTNEQQFGLLSFDRHKIKVDGDLSEWTSDVTFGNSSKNGVAMVVDHDERYLYIQLKGDLLNSSSAQVFIDVVPNQGKTAKSDIKDISFSNGVDFVVELNKNQQSRVVIDPYYDFYSYLYGHELNMIETPSSLEKRSSKVFEPIYYVLSDKLYLPKTKETIPFRIYETGKLIEGNGNPNAENYNSLADYCWTSEGVVELRIPWLLLQSKDPSKKEFIGDLYKDGYSASVFIDEIYLGVLLVDSKGSVVDSLPSVKKGVLNNLLPYTWENWNLPLSEERLKQSYYDLKELFSYYE
nr:hypothetical protein [Lysinibacillus timonensis]